ncbi:fatty-acid amide hydrolase 1-like [Cebus imitator]|uniref:fatty-acid amide hydrolase 1-like n=1 Tax=Cebus imitator TaxID=2715852 RepID=UPI0018995EF1|nr:fatty-acid amide hydrolase 1-like [Cebus imitator]
MSLKDTYDFPGEACDQGQGHCESAQGPRAISFAKTNIPQTLIRSLKRAGWGLGLGFECSNPTYGQTLNPLNLKKTSGGSSAGEAVLLAESGSILGMGTDTGGSIRIPASFCGVHGLRTTGSRLRHSLMVVVGYTGVASAIKGKKSVSTVAGPMARDVESLALCLRALLSEDMHRLDPTVPRMPFREEVYTSNQPLRIGYYESDGYTQPSPSMARAVQLTCWLLQDAGHQVIPFSVPRTAYAIKHLLVGGLFADGGATFLEKLEGDIVDPTIKGLVKLLRLPDPIKGFLSWILKYIYPRTSQQFEELRGVGTPKKLWEQHTAVEEYQQEFIAKWRSLDLDVLLAPALAPALCAGCFPKSSECQSYSSLYNVLDFPVGVVPVATVTPQDEEELVFYKGYYGDSSDKHFPEVVSGSVGLPVAAQCIALPWEDELCLWFMKEVDTLVKNQRGPK